MGAIYVTVVSHPPIPKIDTAAARLVRFLFFVFTVVLPFAPTCNVPSDLLDTQQFEYF